MQLTPVARNILTRMQAALESRVFRVLFTTGIVGYLGYQLTDVGWLQIGQSLPTQPLYYVLFVILYFNAPFIEIISYRLIWQFRFRDGLAAFIRKKIYNKEVFGFSGELYFYSWARRNVKLPDLDLMKGVRDQNIVSGAASTSTGLLMLVFFLLSGEISIPLPQRTSVYVVTPILIAGLVLIISWHFRLHPFSIPWKSALTIFGLHFGRTILIQLLQILQWAVVLPDVPWSAWFTYAAIQIIVSRIPILPNRDLIFLSAGVGIAGTLGVPESAVSGLLLVGAILGKAANLLLYVWTTLVRGGEPANGISTTH